MLDDDSEPIDIASVVTSNYLLEMNPEIRTKQLPEM